MQRFINNPVSNTNENKHRKVYRHVLFIISSRFYITEALRTKSIFKGLLSNRHATSLTTKSKQIHLVFSDLSRITGEQNSNTDPMHSFVTSCFNQWEKNSYLPCASIAHWQPLCIYTLVSLAYLRHKSIPSV